MDEPLPAPTGSRAMAMFLEQQTAAEATSQQPRVVAAAPTSTAAITARKVDITPSVDRPQGQQPTEPQQQQNGMSPLEHETASAMLGILTKYKEADPFRNPVDVEELRIPDYFDIITQPMDFKTVRQKLRAGQYSSMQEWRDDLQLIFDNARKYNGDDHPVSQQAIKLQAALERRMDDAKEAAERNLQAAGRGEPKPRKSVKPRSNAEVLATDSSLPGSSDSEEAPPRDARKVAVKRDSEAEADPGKPFKRLARDSAPAGVMGAAAAAAGGGGYNQGLDLESLTNLLNTPMARQLGAEEPDDLAFLALWKRLMVRKQQLAAAVQDAEALRNSNQQLRNALATAKASIARLQSQLDQGHASSALQEQLQRKEEEAAGWKAECVRKDNIIEVQKNVMEQQQEVLRKLAAQKKSVLLQEVAEAEGKAPAS